MKKKQRVTTTKKRNVTVESEFTVTGTAFEPPFCLGDDWWPHVTTIEINWVKEGQLKLLVRKLYKRSFDCITITTGDKDGHQVFQGAPADYLLQD
jgi:hypothetical protein